jgi:hypothetical protein
MPEFGQLRSLLVPLPSFQKDRADYDLQQGRLADDVTRDHSRAESEYLESVLDPTARRFDMTADNRFVFLTPYNTHGNVYLPLLAVSANYSGAARPKLNVSVLIYSQHQTGVDCLSYRFDSPNLTTGDHDYFHMQFAWGPRDDRRHRHALRWISRKDPSIPLDASNCVELLLASIISFRNTHIRKDLIYDRWQQAGLPIRTLLGNMALTRWKAAWGNAAPQETP